METKTIASPWVEAAITMLFVEVMGSDILTYRVYKEVVVSNQAQGFFLVIGKLRTSKNCVCCI